MVTRILAETPYDGKEDTSQHNGEMWPSYADAMQQAHCSGYVFEVASKTCTIGWGDHLYLPETVLTHQTGVRVSACPKCGDGLDPADPA